MSTSGNLSKSHLFNVQDGTIVLADEGKGGDHQIERQPDDVVDNKYQILALLGKGGMGAVYRAEHLMLHKDVALKTFRNASLTEDDCLRFQREAKAIARLNHKHVVRVFDYGFFEDGVPYYTMEFLLGQPLAERLKKHGPLPVDQAIDVFIQICQGLAEAHSKGIIHRDLKPGNLFIESTLMPKGKIDIIKIVDFGIASLSTQTLEGQQVTAHGTIMGSPLYMSPEHAAGHDVTERSDIYSLGCSLFESLAGKPPFRGKHALETLMMHQNQPPPTLRNASGNMQFPGALERLVASMLEKSPEKRPAGVAAVEAELAKLSSKAAISMSGKDTTERSGASMEIKSEKSDVADGEETGQIKAPVGKPALAALAPVAVLLLFGLLGFGYFAKGRPPVPVIAKSRPIAQPPAASQSTNPAAKADVSSQSRIRDNAPVNTPVNTPVNAPVNTPVNAPVNASVNAPVNAPILRSAGNGPDGKRQIVVRFPKGIDFGTLHSRIDSGWEMTARDTVRWPQDDAPLFTPSETFFSAPNALAVFEPDDFWGLSLKGCRNDQRDSEVLGQLCRFTGLRDLDISESELGDDDIGKLKQLTKLEILNLSDTNFTGRGLATLPQIQKLIFLNVERCHGVSELLAKLKGNKCIRELYLDGNIMTLEDYKTIGSMSNLLRLSLDLCDTTDEELKALTPLSKMRKLACRKSKLTAKAVESLKVMSENSLRELDLQGTAFPTATVAEIKRLVPHTGIAEEDYTNMDSIPSSAWKGLDKKF